MTIGLLLPSLLATKRNSQRIFAPKDLFITLANGLVDRGHTVYAYTASDVETKAQIISGDKLLENQDLPSTRLRRKNKESAQAMQTKLTAIEYEADLTAKALIHAKENRVEVMHSYHDFLIHYFAKLVPEIPVVYTIHDPLEDSNTIEGWRFDHFSKDNFLAISQSQANIFRSRVNVIDVVYHGLDISLYPFSPEAGDYLAFVGRVIPEKGVEDAIEAAEATYTPLHLATSDNYLATSYYSDVIKPRFNKKLMSLTGFLERKQRAIWLAKARALLFPIKWQEPFGLAMIEAMAVGTPVIAYNNGSVAEIVRDGVTGFIVEPDISNLSHLSNLRIKKRGIEGLVKAIKRIAEIDRRACREHVEENFTVEKMVEGHERVYQKILQAKSSGK